MFKDEVAINTLQNFASSCSDPQAVLYEDLCELLKYVLYLEKNHELGILVFQRIIQILVGQPTDEQILLLFRALSVISRFSYFQQFVLNYQVFVDYQEYFLLNLFQSGSFLRIYENLFVEVTTIERAQSQEQLQLLDRLQFHQYVQQLNFRLSEMLQNQVEVDASQNFEFISVYLDFYSLIFAATGQLFAHLGLLFGLFLPSCGESGRLLAIVCKKLDEALFHLQKSDVALIPAVLKLCAGNLPLLAAFARSQISQLAPENALFDNFASFLAELLAAASASNDALLLLEIVTTEPGDLMDLLANAAEAFPEAALNATLLLRECFEKAWNLAAEGRFPGQSTLLNQQQVLEEACDLSAENQLELEVTNQQDVQQQFEQQLLILEQVKEDETNVFLRQKLVISAANALASLSRSAQQAGFHYLLSCAERLTIEVESGESLNENLLQFFFDQIWPKVETLKQLSRTNRFLERLVPLFFEALGKLGMLVDFYPEDQDAELEFSGESDYL